MKRPQPGPFSAPLLCACIDQLAACMRCVLCTAEPERVDHSDDCTAELRTHIAQNTSSSVVAIFPVYIGILYLYRRVRSFVVQPGLRENNNVRVSARRPESHILVLIAEGANVGQEKRREAMRKELLLPGFNLCRSLDGNQSRFIAIPDR